MHKSKYKTFSPIFRATALISVLITTLILSACGGGGGNGGGNGNPSPTPTPRPPDNMNIVPIGDMNNVQNMLPAPIRLTTAPQAGGSDFPNIEVAGSGSIGNVRVFNNSSQIVTFSAGNWFEPKDGKYQRMIVTRNTQAPPGQVVTIPAACMQQGKSVPASGLRFFSRPKPISGSSQQCQRNCLTRSLSNIQSCVWGCESGPEPASVRFVLQDGCNDGFRIEYRYFGISSNNERVGVWPAGGGAYYTQFYDQEYASNLACASGITKICYGGKTGNRTWGAGYDGTRGCTDCCTSCPTSGTVTTRVRLVCN